ncbi:MAG: sugar phosphate isomerase/epimerase family protein [Acidimicrobiales bacterium]
MIRELVLSHFSLPRFHPIDDRVRLAATHGFDGIGLYTGQYEQLERDGFAPHGLAELLEQHGIRLREIEVIGALGATDDGRARADVAWRMAEAFGCRYAQVIGPAGDDLDAAARAFGDLCDRAADHGLVLGLEFLPFNDIPDVHTARRLVEAAGRANGGICVDIWHHERGARDLDAIAALPSELITGIQLNDGTVEPQQPHYYTDCLANRVAMGDGEFDVRGFLDTVHGTGTTAGWSLEVPNAWGWAHPDQHVAAIAAGIRRFL